MSALAEIAPDRPGAAISAVGVVVPARDEQARIAACLTSVRHALAAVGEEVEVAVAVVLDRCTDTTPARVAALIADWPQAVAVAVVDAPPPRDAGSNGRSPGPVTVSPSGARRDTPSPWATAAGVPVAARRLRGSGVGALRDLGVRAVLPRLTAHRSAATWLLSTDADTIVPDDWVRAHLQCAHAGADAVAGLADLVGAEHLAADALRRYRAIVHGGLRGDSHDHVYGANLGVRADAYLAVGGFPPDGVGEDHGLWQRLGAAGYTLAQPVGVRVRTSARLRGRADDGLAGLLRSLHRSPAQHGPAQHGPVDPASGGPVRGGA